MCTTQAPLTLNETEDSQINWCPGCQSYSLVYRNGCISLDSSELNQFIAALDDLRADSFCYDFLGQPHAILRGSRSYMGFCLSRQDVSALKTLIREALIVHEAYQLVQT